MGLLGSIADIINKFIPSQRKRDILRLQKLEELYAEALSKGNDTDAALYRKEMKQLRQVLGYET